MKKELVEEFFQCLYDKDPEPKGELDYTNDYTLLVAVALSAQATDIGVNKATKKLFQEVSTPEDMIALGEEGLKKHIKTIGLFNSKAKNVMLAAHMLVKDFNSQVPETREDLEKLAGVGRKTANVVLNLAFGIPTIAVDTHLFRVGNRTGIAPGKTPLEVEKKLDRKIPAHWKLNAHHWLILHGRYVCKARTPECPKCVISHICRYKAKNL